ncbi:MAG TPA: hypothetical protein EYP49_01135 [Anaerolineae bacterium]|nr:hypothetical protein [Anaerolineae bacterium]
MLFSLLDEKGPVPPLAEEESQSQATELGRSGDLQVYPESVAATGEAIFFLGRKGVYKFLGIVFKDRNSTVADFVGEGQAISLEGQGFTLKLCPTNHANAVALRAALPYTAPQVLGLQKSVGCGDRLGLATAGHVRAVRQFSGIAPIFAQQSVRENARTGRTPQQVLDDATWGVFQEGWRQPWGADADHLKTPADVDSFVSAGYTFYTIDPGDHVDNEAHTAAHEALVDKVHALPWDVLEDTPQALNERYLERTFDPGEGFELAFSEEILLRAAAKYGRAIAHTVQMYRHLVNRIGDKPFELEVSVDETETPTSPHEHFFVASELKRLGVQWVSLAPRYIGRFEKGVDYSGDLARFEAEFVKHAAIARHLGPYKLSLHSGSDKFSIYPIIARHAGDLVHLKTAGTSYLEALRAIAGIDPPLFREILAFAHERYGEDKATYHVSADPAKVPAPDQLADSELAGVLDLFDGRQVLHVTFGSVLTARDKSGGYRFRDRVLGALRANEETYYAALEHHFARHLAPFAHATRNTHHAPRTTHHASRITHHALM